jgi:hypothetical protein
MDKSGIGVPQILPPPGAEWQQRRAPRERRSDRESGGKAAPDDPLHVPPPSGTGLLVDKSV